MAVHLPVLSLELWGDDFQWVQAARDIARGAAAPLAPVGQFFRPALALSLLPELAVWGRSAAGIHADNLLLHAIAALLLVALARRLAVPPLAAWLAGVVWAVAPFTMLPVAWLAARHDQNLLIGWLVLLLSWPNAEQTWRPPRLAAALAGGCLALLSKESWVVAPGLVLTIELALRRRPLRRALMPALAAGVPALLYTAAHLLLLPGHGTYLRFSPEVLAKLPHIPAAFMFLEAFSPKPERVSLAGVLGCAVLAGIVALGWRRSPAVPVGLALMLLPVLPVLAVPYLPIHYTHVPFAGFVLAVAGLGAALLHELRGSRRTLAAAGAALLVLLYVAASVRLVRGTHADFARISAAVGRLITEARAVGPLPVDRPVIVVRLERDNPLHEVATSPRGLYQYHFVRHTEPYGLTDAAALFEWTGAAGTGRIVRHDDWASWDGGRPGAVLAHQTGGFAWLPDVPDVAATARSFEQRGLRLTVVGRQAPAAR